MGDKLDKSRQAVAQFFKTANPEDEFFLVQFNDNAQLIQPFTHNLEEIQNRLTFTQSKGQHRAARRYLYGTARDEEGARIARKALLIISDGGDNNSRYTETEVKNLVKEADVQIYAIGIYEMGGARGRTPEEASGPGLADRNGGADRRTHVRSWQYQ